jgi:hypothetical protein
MPTIDPPTIVSIDFYLLTIFSNDLNEKIITRRFACFAGDSSFVFDIFRNDKPLLPKTKKALQNRGLQHSEDEKKQRLFNNQFRYSSFRGFYKIQTTTQSRSIQRLSILSLEN